MMKRRTLLLGATRIVALLPVMTTAANSPSQSNPVAGVNTSSPPVTPNRAWLCVGRAALAVVATRTLR
jgi:hypothetical protein